MKLIAEVPTRIDIAGGTLDIYPLSEILAKSITINLGITVPAKVTIEAWDGESIAESLDLDKKQKLPISREESALPLISEIFNRIWQSQWPSIRITTECQSPAGAGLGGSSALGIALAAALNNYAAELKLCEKLKERDLVNLVQSVETRIIHCPAGCQDYWGAIRGRINMIRFTNGLPNVETLGTDQVDYLNERLIVCFSGKSRASGMNNWSIFREAFEGNMDLIGKLNGIAELTEKMALAIREQNWGQALELSGEEWLLRKQLWPNIETDETKEIDQIARENGALFSRVCGAGGGGVMAIFVHPDQRQNVIEALNHSRGTVMNAVISNEGLRVSTYQ